MESLLVAVCVRGTCRYSWIVDCCCVIYINIHLSFHKANVIVAAFINLNLSYNPRWRDTCMGIALVGCCSFATHCYTITTELHPFHFIILDLMTSAHDGTFVCGTSHIVTVDLIKTAGIFGPSVFFSLPMVCHHGNIFMERQRLISY